MTPSISLIVTARDELEISIAQFQSYKSAVERLLNSTVTVKKETLIALRKKFELSLKDLNKCHTIWRCMHEENGSESLIADYSTSWLESVWYEHSDLDDDLDERIYSYPISSPAQCIKAHG